MKVIVSELPYDATVSELRILFEAYGDVVSVDLPIDHMTGKITGTAIVEMSSMTEAEEAAKHLHHQYLHGRRMRVRIEEPRKLGDTREPVLVGNTYVDRFYPTPLVGRPEWGPGTRARRAGR